MGLEFCGNSTFDPISGGNLSPCFVYTSHSFLVAIFALLVGIYRGVQLVSQKVPDPDQEKRSKWDHVILLCGFLEVGLSLASLVLVALETKDHLYLVVSFSLLTFSWMLMFAVMLLEMNRNGSWDWPYKMLVWLSALFLVLELTYYSIELSKRPDSLSPLDTASIALFFGRLAGILLWMIALFGLKRRFRHKYQRLPQELNHPGGGQTSGSPFEGFGDKLKKLLPFLWPQKDRLLQAMVVICFIILLINRVINLFVPIYLGIVVDKLSGENGQDPVLPIADIFIYVGLRFLQGGGGGSMGFLTNLRQYLWIRVEQYTTREISVQTFAHLHDLSLRYHLQRKTGEVLRVIDRGTTSISQLLSALVFNILPTFLDIGIAIVYFVTVFDIYYGLIVVVAMFSYMFVTVVITEWRTRFRREMIETDNDARQKAVDSLLNFETVKYYGAEDYEIHRYRGAILLYQDADWRSQASLVLLNTLQNVAIILGLLAGTLLAAYQVVEGTLTVGDFTLFLTYLTQLYAPLNWLGTYYRTIQQNFIDMEKMLQLLEENVEIRDDPDAVPLQVTKGELVFDDVTFCYDEKTPAVQNISFKIPAGQTFALVGSSGGGKSTIMRLVFRFYDVTSGSIKIDGQDLRQVTQSSLRKQIGVVPQDTVLFNDTVEYNVRYGKLEASEEEVIDAAKAAQIHDKIISFPERYKTRVGERGLRLSGGEKQRVAIARTLLKNPKIVLLDEATSALDTETERQIQESLAAMSANRTTLVVAHRLSTIINADQILVLKQGSICERGTHQELIALDGEYAKLWKKQLESNAQAKEREEKERELKLDQEKQKQKEQ